MRKLKDGWAVHNEWVEYEDYKLIYDDEGYVIKTIGLGKRTHWVETNCPTCGQVVSMPLSKLVASGSEQCDGCRAYNDRYR